MFCVTIQKSIKFRSIISRLFQKIKLYVVRYSCEGVVVPPYSSVVGVLIHHEEAITFLIEDCSL